MTLQTITTGDGCPIAYRFDGPDDGPVLLLSNSLGTTMDMWEPQMHAFSRDFRVLRYDSRGHGNSGTPVGAYSMDRLGRDVLELLDALGIEDFDFCGLSLGGMVGQWLAIREPVRLKRVILANTSSFMGPPSGWETRISDVLRNGMASIADASVARWFTEAFQMQGKEPIANIRAMLLGTSIGGYAGCCAAIRDMDMRRPVQSVKCPALIIGGAFDYATPPEHSEMLAKDISGAELIMLDAAHLSNVEQVSEFTEVCLQFLAD